MSGAGRALLKNMGALLVSQAVTWSLTLGLTIVLPRYLGAANVGKLFFANSVWAMAMVVVTFGMDMHLTKEIARQPESLRSLLGISIALRFVLFIFALAGVLLYLEALRYPPETMVIAGIIAIASLLAALTSGCQAALQGIERMEYVALGSVAGKVVYSLLAMLMLFAGYGVYAVAAVAVLGSLVSLLIEVRAVVRVSPAPAAASEGGLRQAWTEARRMLRASLPYLMSNTFLVAYMQIDVVILSLLLDERAIGWYGAANQFFGTLLFVPTIVITAIFPALSRLHATDPDVLRGYMQRSFNLLILLVVPIGLGIVLVADPLVVLLFGREFANSGPILAALGVVLILTSQNMLVGTFLIAGDRQRQWTATQAVLGLVTVPLDLVLVPWCQRALADGALGGALSYIITEAAMLATAIVLMPKGSLDRRNATVAVRSLAAGVVMIAATWWSRSLFLAIPIVWGAAVYLVMLWLLRAVPREEIRYARDLAVPAIRRGFGREPEPAAATREI